VVTTDAADKVETSLFKEIEACAGKWAIEAGERLAARARGSLHIEYKGNGTSNPVSEADREAEEFLFREISHRFPDECVIGEEGRDPGPDRTPIVWVIDPLDGTTNYLNGLSLWCVSIGVLWYGVPIAGAIYTPLGPDGGPALFTARKAGGARMNGQPISVDADPCLHPARLSHLPAAYQSEIERRREIRGRKDVRTLGSIALELALTSCGALPFVAFWIPRLWDVVGRRLAHPREQRRCPPARRAGPTLDAVVCVRSAPGSRPSQVARVDCCRQPCVEPGSSQPHSGRTRPVCVRATARRLTILRDHRQRRLA